MKVAFLTHEPFYPPSGGGSAEAIYLVQEMVARGWEVHLFCPRVDDPDAIESRFKVRLHPFTRWQMGRYTSLRTPKYLVYPFFLQKEVELADRTFHFDLIFSQHAISAVAAGRLKQSLRRPVVMNFLDYLTGFMQTWPPYLAPPPLLAILNKFELSLPRRHQVDGVLTVSDTLAERIAGAGFPREKIQPIYYGYDAELFSLRPPEAFEESWRVPTVVMHGSLDHHHLKGIALEAVRRISEARPDTIFKFIGHRTGTLENFLREAAARAPRAKTECTGFVPYGDIGAHLSAATVGIVPYEESAGTHCAFVAKIVEYLGVGLPAVSTGLKGAMRFFGNEPRVRFTRFEGADFADKVLEVLSRRDANEFELARRASERVRRELDWRAISARALDFVENKVLGPALKTARMNP